MTKQELIRPRFKVITDYPDSCLEVGEIISILDADIFEPIEWWEKYPLQFKKLKWYEERTTLDMPDFVKVITPGCSLKQYSIHEVDYWFCSDRGIFAGLTIPETTRTHDEGETVTYHTINIEPATEIEYNEYLKKINS